MMGQPNKWIFLCVLSLFVVLTSHISFFYSGWQRFSVETLRVVDTTLRVMYEMRITLFPTKDRVEQAMHLQIVEKENRLLQGTIQSLQTENEHLKKLSSQSAFLSQHPPGLEAVISKTTERWLILTATPLTSGTPLTVYKDGVFIGIATDIQGRQATFKPVSTGELSFLVRHEPSARLGMLTGKGNTLEVSFFETIESMKEGDLLVTVPNGEGIPAFVPVLKVQAIDPALSQATTRVSVIPLVPIQVADVVILQP